jgi:hypothetical protein
MRKSLPDRIREAQDCYVQEILELDSSSVPLQEEPYQACEDALKRQLHDLSLRNSDVTYHVRVAHAMVEGARTRRDG